MLIPAPEQIQAAARNEEEEIVLSFRPSFRRYIIGSGEGLWLVVFLLILAPFTFGASLLALIGFYISNKYTNYQITNQRIRIKKGIFVRHEDDIELYRLKDVKSRVSLWNRIFKIGSVDIISSEVTDNKRQSHLTFKFIDMPSDIREILRILAEAARKKRNVREIDIY